jgi:hypothetical protein
VFLERDDDALAKSPPDVRSRSAISLTTKLFDRGNPALWSVANL